jgi:hypothetical protein
MALVYKDRIRQKASPAGTGNVTLTNPVDSYVQFQNASLGADTFPYAIVNGTQFEVGIGAYIDPGTSGSPYGVVTRNTVLSNSSGTTSLINFNGNTADVFITNASELSVLVSAQPTPAAFHLIKWTGSQYELIEPIQNGSALGGTIDSSVMFYDSTTTNYQADPDLKFYPGNTPELFVNGVIQATAKAFKIKHPILKNKFLMHGCLEGPEYGMYQRGIIKTRWCAEIVLPDYFLKISENPTIAVTSNSFMSFKIVKMKNSFIIKNLIPSLKPIEYNYLIIGSRTDTKFSLES